MLFKNTFIVALLPLALASPVPSRVQKRDAAPQLDEVTSLLDPVTSTVSGLTGDILKREAQLDEVTSLLEPVTSTVSSLTGEVLKREAAPQLDEVTSLLEPVTSTVSGVVGEVLKREAAPELVTLDAVAGLAGDVLKREAAPELVTLDAVAGLAGDVLKREAALTDFIESVTSTVSINGVTQRDAAPQLDELTSDGGLVDLATAVPGIALDGTSYTPSQVTSEVSEVAGAALESVV